jgi:DNA-binding MarR family transcriptional regulator
MTIPENDNKAFDFEQFRTIRRRSVGKLFWRVKRYMDAVIEPSLHRSGYTDFKMSYLTLLANIEETGTTNRELAKKACVSKQMMSKVVSLLEAEGYIYVEKHPADSRSSVIFLSQRGKDMFVSLRDSMQQVRDRFDAIVGYDRMETLIDILVELAEGLEGDEK